MTTTQNKPKTLFAIGSIFCIVLGVLYFRRPDAFTHPQFWAEDGNLFFKNYEEMGVRSVITPYNGYLHFVPRLIVALWNGLGINYLYIPTLYNWSALVITFLVSVHLWYTSAYLGIRQRIAFAVSFVFLPLSADIFMTITNLNWMTSLVLVNFMLTRYTDKGSKYYTGTLIMLAIAGLTGPFSTLLIPVIFVALIVERKSLSIKKVAPLAVIAACGIIQVICIKFIDPAMVRSYPGQTESWHLLRVITNNIAQAICIYNEPMADNTKLIICVLVFVILMALVIVGYKKITIPNKYILPLTGLIMMAIFVKTYWPNESLIMALRNARYYFIPYTCICWTLLIAFDNIIGLWYLVLCVIYIRRQREYTVIELQDKHWKRQVMEYQAGRRDTFEIPPDDWKFTIDKKRK